MVMWIRNCLSGLLPTLAACAGASAQQRASAPAQARTPQREVDAKGLRLLPGLIDAHFHLDGLVGVARVAPQGS
jgi:cytosine/adenosine deaminase-related metal-dependent hydrolase